MDCICVGGRTYCSQPDECVNCALCVSVCPVEAICYEDHLPPRSTGFVATTTSVSTAPFPAAAGMTSLPSTPSSSMMPLPAGANPAVRPRSSAPTRAIPSRHP